MNAGRYFHHLLLTFGKRSTLASLPTCILLLVALLFRPTLLLAESQTLSLPQFGIQLTYDEDWKQEAIQAPGVLLLLRDKRADYPSFNILASTTIYDVGRSVSDQADELVESYSLSGLKHVRVARAETRERRWGTVFEAQLEYTVANTTMQSIVIMIPRNSYHLILTYVSDRAIKETKLEKLLAGLELEHMVSVQEQPVHNSDKNLWVALLCVMSVLVLRWWYVKQPH